MFMHITYIRTHSCRAPGERDMWRPSYIMPLPDISGETTDVRCDKDLVLSGGEEFVFKVPHKDLCEVSDLVAH